MLLVHLGKKYPAPPIPVDAVDDALAAFQAVSIYSDLDDDDWVTIAKVIKSQVKITMEAGTTLTASDYQRWLDAKVGEIDWKRWVAYKQLLISKGFAPNVLATLDAATAEILECLGDPTWQGEWKRRGLVIGDVQSGKTATYLGVVNRAADAGYKLIVLLAGGTEALRKQTQLRVDEGLMGKNTASAMASFGVGTWHSERFLGAQPLTTQMTDFRKTSKEATGIMVDPGASAPLVFVIKKNKTALENVRDWINEQRTGDARLDVPMLVVDDESDYASVNTKAENDPTKINGLIREILGTVTKSSYLAFTATPFANVFIDHATNDEALGDDLFPRDYIRTLEAPSNYVGSRVYFGTGDAQDDSKLMSPDDAEEFFPFKHKSHLAVTELPDSLVEAIRTFVVASAIREHRGDSSPRSMLVNVSRFKNVQSQVHALVESEFERIRNAIELHAAGIGSDGEQHVELMKLRDTFDAQYPQAGVQWRELAKPLKAAVHGTSVRLINSDRVKNANDLGEVESARMIAVGGDVLSRGLTLDGLTVSYFHRQVGAADTLLQMARWFGYRPGYEDLCRVWIPSEVADHFRYVGDVVDELRDQLRVMKKKDMTPEHFGLRVRMHPESLLVTARNKMRAAEAKTWTINVAGAKNLETVQLSTDIERIKKNHEAVVSLVDAVEATTKDSTWAAGSGSIKAVRDVPREVVSDFLERYTGYVADTIFADSALAAFVRTSSEKYSKWTVGFVQGQRDKAEVALGGHLTLRPPSRGVLAGVASGGGTSHPYLRVSGTSSRLAGSDDVARAAEVDRQEPQTEPDVYAHFSQPVLLVYALELGAKRVKTPSGDTELHGPTLKIIEELGRDRLVMGVKVGIPGEPGDKAAEVKYMLNSVALQSWAGINLDDEADDPNEVDGADDE